MAEIGWEMGNGKQSVQISDEAMGVIQAVAKKRQISLTETAELLISTGAKRLLALEKYARKKAQKAKTQEE